MLDIFVLTVRGFIHTFVYSDRQSRDFRKLLRRSNYVVHYKTGQIFCQNVLGF